MLPELKLRFAGMLNPGARLLLMREEELEELLGHPIARVRYFLYAVPENKRYRSSSSKSAVEGRGQSTRPHFASRRCSERSPRGCRKDTRRVGRSTVLCRAAASGRKLTSIYVNAGCYESTWKTSSRRFTSAG